ncbi:peptidyl-prolyl cis-trans isomerase D isoform X1 [Drosophila miranda]|uniref:peptidyl-prolyl cis-trans isomerase D isoform X1 n=1 Tax=Drosophila miranda TaxID=7229 RepID=UPI0007E828D4|nr:peptidyl-prolyl cis-trans isomerase D isoform X1 [Drosophila miranda]
MDWYIGTEWKDEKRGLSKKVLSLEFADMAKPMAASTVLFSVNNKCANLEDRPSKYLGGEESLTFPQQHTLEMGTATTPVDCYVEMLLQQFMPGETAACSITSKTGERIEFDLKLDLIVKNPQVHKLNAAEIYELALRFKESGVAMFKSYPKFAFDYFARAAKLLITYKPFDQLTKKSNGINGTTVEALFVQLQTNLAACMLQEERYEHVIYHTEFVERAESPTEKSVYRRALAYYHMKEFAKAQATIERVHDYEEKREFSKLRDKIAASWKDSMAHYKEVVQRMFS